MARMLVAYYSWTNGNTRRVAERLRDVTGADLVRIDTEVAYPSDYDATVDQGRREVEEGFLPELAPLGADPAAYDVVAVGTPTWWYTMAPAVHAFLSRQDWSGKVMVPFMTNAGWPGHVIDDMGLACPGASVVEPLEVRFGSDGGSLMQSPRRLVDEWAERVATLSAGGRPGGTGGGLT